MKSALELLRDRLARAAQRDAFWHCLLPLALLVIELLGALGSAAHSYDHWDNFEFYTPTIAAAHGQLLRGELPLWNPHQHLGESFLANPQMGTFYPPYTLAYAAVVGLGLHWKWLCGLIFFPHLCLGAAGSFALLRQLGVRRSLCFIAALGLCSAGYLRTGAAFWIFYAPTFGWLPWTLLGAIRLLDGSRRFRDGALFVAGLTAQAYVGHPQILVYVWLTVGLVCAGYLLIGELAGRARLRAVSALAARAACALLLSLLTMWPLFVHSRNTVRKAPMSFEDFIRISVSPQGLLGLLLPGYRIRDGFVVRESVAFMLHQAAWVLPGLLLGGWLWLQAERRREPTEERSLGRRAAVLGVAGGVMLVFALGRYLKVYGWTYGIPVWSSFRYPHKFLCVALPCLGLAAALGLELLARRAESRAQDAGASKSETRWRAFAAGGFLLLALAPALVIGWNEVVWRPVVALGLACGVVSLALTTFVHLPAARAVLALCGIGSAASMVVFGQTFAPYLIDEPHAPPSARYAPSGEARILPVHLDRNRFDIYPRLLYQSATMLGVDSVTGCTTSMAPDQYLTYLPSNSRGLLPEEVYRELIPSHFLRSLNVRYATAPLGDAEIEGWLRAGGFQLDHQLEKVALYRTDSTLPRAYFASEVWPFSDAEFRRGLLQNGADVRAAYVEADGAALPPGAPEGAVLHADFADPNRTQLEVESQQGGLLVVSASYDPDWHARVDGDPTVLLRTNGMLQGLRVPPGRHAVVLSYQSASLRQALWLAALGALWFAALSLVAPLSRRLRGARQER
ncbi:MAG: hypothetical protein RL033_510 [Pseudomonadota bacterium]